MAAGYKFQGRDGGWIYSDTPPNPNNGEWWGDIPANRTNQDYARRFIIDQPSRESKAESDYKFAKEVIAAVRKYIPNAEKYIDALNYLRTHNETAFQAALQELRQKNPRAWIELQKSPLFREKVPQGYNNLRAFVRTVSDGAQGKPALPLVMDSVVDHVVTEAEKRGYRYALKAEAFALGRTFSQVGGEFVGLGLTLLDPENANNISLVALTELLEVVAGNRLSRPPPVIPMDEIEYLRIHNLIAQGRYKEAKEAIVDWIQSHR